jgi:hypothetical protein
MRKRRETVLRYGARETRLVCWLAGRWSERAANVTCVVFQRRPITEVPERDLGVLSQAFGHREQGVHQNLVFETTKVLLRVLAFVRQR